VDIAGLPVEALIWNRCQATERFDAPQFEFRDNNYRLDVISRIVNNRGQLILDFVTPQNRFRSTDDELRRFASVQGRR
jgi:hypothetical protein